MTDRQKETETTTTSQDQEIIESRRRVCSECGEPGVHVDTDAGEIVLQERTIWVSRDEDYLMVGNTHGGRTGDLLCGSCAEATTETKKQTPAEYWDGLMGNQAVPEQMSEQDIEQILDDMESKLGNAHTVMVDTSSHEWPDIREALREYWKKNGTCQECGRALTDHPVCEMDECEGLAEDVREGHAVCRECAKFIDDGEARTCGRCNHVIFPDPANDGNDADHVGSDGVPLCGACWQADDDAPNDQTGSTPEGIEPGIRDISEDEYDGDVRDIVYRIDPIDVGFDLRVAGMSLAIDPADDPMTLSYRVEGELRVVKGGQSDIIAWLETRGYSTVIQAREG